MDFVQNFPFFCIIFSMFSAIISFVFRSKGAKRMHLIMVCAVLVLSLATLAYCVQTGESYTYTMGHYEAPWGNEIRIGPLEALMASFFALIMLFDVVGGMEHLEAEIQDSKKNLFYIILDLLMASLLALVYTNDLFTGYVFIEINTIAACGMIMIKKEGRTYACAIRYMIMSLVGSGLFLIGLSLLYGVTGHLLMSPAKEALAELVASGTYHIPVLVIIILITVGLCIKSGLYPFHTWIPDAYSYTTPACSAILSSLVCKGYIFLLIKIFYRVLGMESVLGSHITNIVFIFALIGMIMGSVDAIKQSDIRRMTAYSSVAQIGYIYMGIGLGTTAGVAAALFHILSHGTMKSLLFLSISGLSDASGGKTNFRYLRGAGHRNQLAGAAYTVGALSMVGMPLLTGFVSKYLFAAAAAETGIKMLPAWIVLALSTVLNAVYFMRTVLTIYRADKKESGVSDEPAPVVPKNAKTWAFGTVGLMLLVVVLGVAAKPVIQIIETGLAVFG